MTDRQLYKETFAQLHASEDTITEVLNMARKQEQTQAKRHPARTGLLIALAAVLLMGSAFAAVRYKLRADRLGDLAVAVSVAEEGTSPGAVAFSGEASDTAFHPLEMTAGWLPEGMENVPGETVKWDWPEDGWRGGFSLGSWPLNAGNATFCEVVTDAESQESLTIDGHEAIYVKQTSDGGFNQRMFISYPEYNAVLTMYIGANVTRDDAIKFAENLTVTPGTWEMDAENLEYNGKRYLDAANFIATGVYVNTADEVTPEEIAAMEAAWAERDPANRAVKANMADAHALGESFPVTFAEHRDGLFVGFTDLDVKVTDVSIRDDYSALRDTKYLDLDWASRVDENGRLPRADYVFVVCGDGVNTPSLTTVATLPDQQLYMVAVTVEVTNNTDHTVESAGYNGRLLSIAETPEGWTVTEPKPADSSVAYDDGWCTGGGRLEDMRYWDLRWDGSNGGNEITDLAPGESVTIQMGFVVSECQMGDLWFYMNDADIEGPDEIRVGYVPVE